MNRKGKYNYFNQFILMTECIVESANTLKRIMENFNFDELDADINEVHKLENDADKIVHEMRNYLIKDFLPPIDREDITLICHKLDDIEDGIDEVLINVKILNITEIKKEVIEQINILISCCKAVNEMFLDFNNFKKYDLINQKVIEVNQLEEQGDKIFERLIASLYRNEKDPIELIKWTNIYNCLEATIDGCEELCDCVEDVVMKNS